MENKAHALAAGAFVLVVTAMLVALAAWLTRDVGIRTTYELSSRESVSGLQPQAAVRYRGIAVGKVTSIGFDPAAIGNVLIRIAVDSDAPVTRSTFASLGFQGVTGLAYVQLDDNGESKEVLKSDDGAPARIPLRPGLLSKLTDQGASILVQVEETTRRLNQLLSADNQKVIVGAVNNIGQAAGGVNTLVQRLDATVTERLDPALATLPGLAADAGKTLQALQGVSKEVSGAAAQAGRTAAEFTRAAQRLNDKGGVLDKLGDGTEALASTAQTLNASTLPRLDRVSDEASRAARSVARTVGALNDNPQSLIFGNGAPPPGPGEPGFVAPGGSK